MSNQEDHEADCVKRIGQSWPDVHYWLDALFSRYGVMHRHCRHHSEGVEVIRSMWGDVAALAAQLHIIDDCWRIPKAADYVNGVVDNMGYNREDTNYKAEKLLQSLIAEFSGKQ